MPYKRASPGYPLSINAGTYNDILSAVEVVNGTKNGKRGGTALSASQRDPACVIVQNKTGSPLAAYTAVGISDVVTVPPATISAGEDIGATNEFTDRMALKLRTPTDADKGKWLIMAEPLAVDLFGTAVGAGVYPCRVNILDTADTKCDVTTTVIPQSGTGGYDLIWVKGGVGSATATGEQWAVIRLGGASPKTKEIDVVTSIACVSGRTVATTDTITVIDDGDDDEE